jgi:putative IMPACT (imprinted ancient) family translation regulator
LVKTYKESTKYTLEHAEIITKELETQLEIEFKFSQQNIIFSLFKFDAKVLNFDAQENCKITAQLKLSEKEKISEQLSEMYEVKYEFLEN